MLAYVSMANSGLSSRCGIVFIELIKRELNREKEHSKKSTILQDEGRALQGLVPK